MRGISGSGKTFKANQIADEYAGKKVIIISADDFFKDISGQYEFVAARLPDAHEACRKGVEIALQAGFDCVIVDNTSLSCYEIKPYKDMAASAGYSAEIAYSDSAWKFDPIECSRRCAHNVPLHVIKKQLQRLQDNPINSIDEI